jgi:hypothetical protein
MFCKWCGVQLVTDASFCTQCGGKVKPTPLASLPAAKYTCTIEARLIKAFFLRNEQRDAAGELGKLTLDAALYLDPQTAFEQRQAACERYEEELEKKVVSWLIDNRKRPLSDLIVCNPPKTYKDVEEMMEEIRQSLWIRCRGYIPGDVLVLVNSEPEVFAGETPTSDIANKMFSLYSGCEPFEWSSPFPCRGLDINEHDEKREFEGATMNIGDLVALMPLKQNSMPNDRFPDSATNGWACFDSQTSVFQKTDFGFVRAELNDQTVIWSDGMNCTLAGAQSAWELIEMAGRLAATIAAREARELR